MIIVSAMEESVVCGKRYWPHSGNCGLGGCPRARYVQRQTDFTWHLPKTLAFELGFTGKAETRQVKERGGKSLQIKRIAFAKSKRHEENFKCRLPAGGSDGVGWQG